MNTIIIVKVRERIINLSYSEAKQLLRKLDSAIRDTDEYKQEVKETQQYLDEFEKSNRQFPDELFSTNFKTTRGDEHKQKCESIRY